MNEPLHLVATAPASEIPDASRSFETFYDAESQTLFRRLWLVTGKPLGTEELMQDAFLKIWERWEQVGAMEDSVGYLYRTAMNLFKSSSAHGGAAASPRQVSNPRHARLRSRTPNAM